MRHVLKLSLPAIAASLLIAACGSSSSSSTTNTAANTQAAQTTSSPSSAVVVKSASNTLGTILVDSQGMTLYHLSGEQNGKFICTSSACVGVWHPLIAQSSSVPSGEVGSLGTVKRPDGTVQITYKGTPLYTFTGDRQAGETKGQGIKDVGTWSVIATSSSGAPTTGSSGAPAATSTSSAPATSTSSAPATSTSSAPATSTSSAPATPAPSTGGSSESSSGGYGY
jgi:predicted lipoprotein with Yx(FWY)xxD motif